MYWSLSHNSNACICFCHLLHFSSHSSYACCTLLLYLVWCVHLTVFVRRVFHIVVTLLLFCIAYSMSHLVHTQCASDIPVPSLTPLFCCLVPNQFHYLVSHLSSHPYLRQTRIEHTPNIEAISFTPPIHHFFRKEERIELSISVTDSLWISLSLKS